MGLNGLYFIYGLSVMFFCMMAWTFWRKGSDRLSRLVTALMAVLAIGCAKDVVFLPYSDGGDSFVWTLLSAIDMVAVPMYAFILMELCRPGWFGVRGMALQELPFIALAALFFITRDELFFEIEVVLAAVYGFGFAVYTVIAIPRYHRHLKTSFSYEENINLNWLRTILFSYFIILSLWIADCMFMNFGTDGVYLLGTLLLWMFVGYFIYRHESVIDELRDLPSAERIMTNDCADCVSDLGRAIRHLFEEERIYLNPHLKLSDVARMAGSNRTYVSRFFNGENGTSFFEYVNRFRVEHAAGLLKDSDEKIEVIAEKSGFNSRQSFHRVFNKLKGCTPEAFRARGVIG